MLRTAIQIHPNKNPVPYQFVRECPHQLLSGMLLGARTGQSQAGETEYDDVIKAISDGRHLDARKILAVLAVKEPEHAGTWLDLAILQCNLGDCREAEALFDAIEARFDPPPAIRELIEEQRRHGCSAPKRRGKVGVQLGLGYDTNVNQCTHNPYLRLDSVPFMLVLAPEHSPQSNVLWQLQSDAQVSLNNNGTQGFAHFVTRKYNTLQRYDLNALSVGAEAPRQFGAWKARTSGAVGLLRLGEKNYQNNIIVQVEIVPPLRLPGHGEESLLAAALWPDYPEMLTFNSLQSELQGQLHHRRDTHSMQLSAGLLTDNTDKSCPDSNRSGWSTSLIGRCQLWGQAVGEVHWSNVRRESSEALSPGLINQPREQNLRQLRLKLTFPARDRQALIAEHRQTTNAEDISIFGYRSEQFSLTWQWLH